MTLHGLQTLICVRVPRMNECSPSPSLSSLASSSSTAAPGRVDIAPRCPGALTRYRHHRRKTTNTPPQIQFLPIPTPSTTTLPGQYSQNPNTHSNTNVRTRKVLCRQNCQETKKLFELTLLRSDTDKKNLGRRKEFAYLTLLDLKFVTLKKISILAQPDNMQRLQNCTRKLTPRPEECKMQQSEKP